MKISLIQPGRNNLKYLKWSYDSIRKNQGSHDVEICVADDASTDGTWKWCEEMMAKDSNFKALKWDGPERVGHTILYDRLVNEIATHDICMIYHADMYLCPGALDSIEENLEDKTIVSLTRIEPPLHPDGPEKILKNYGVEPEEFNESGLLSYIEKSKQDRSGKTTQGIFAPWAFFKKDFQNIGGHDPLYAPQSKEDSDIFNRFLMYGIKFIQTWDGCVYHMTCRGSRRNTVDKAKNIYEDSPEWLAQNLRSTRNFIRKWGQFVEHDQLLMPIVTPKFNIGCCITNCTPAMVFDLEPWFDNLYVDIEFEDYVKVEKSNTLFDLSKRVYDIGTEPVNDIVIKIDATEMTETTLQYLQQLPKIFEQQLNEPGKYKIDCLDIEVKKLTQYQEELIICDTI